MNQTSRKPLPSWLPLVVGALLVVQFAALSVWQISRGLEKRASEIAYRDDTSFTPWQGRQDVRAFQRLRVDGHYDANHQILLENIIVNNRYGYYVITPLIVADEDAVLLVNRGWLEGSAEAPDVDELAVTAGAVSVRGRVGSLPKAGMKMGDAISAGDGWPKRAVYPAMADVAEALSTETQPFVLLLEHDEPNGYLRNWAPAEFGPGKHFGYALQWFAMGAVLAGLLTWNYRKKRFDS